MFPSRPPNVLFSARQQNLNNIGGINHQRFHRQTNSPGDPTVVSNFVDTGSVYGQHQQQQQQQQPPWRRVPFPSPEQVCLESIARCVCNYREILLFLSFSFPMTTARVPMPAAPPTCSTPGRGGRSRISSSNSARCSATTTTTSRFGNRNGTIIPKIYNFELDLG